MSDFFDMGKEKKVDTKMYGVTVAIVTSLDDPENQGRVKVKLLNFGNSDYETGFIRVMTPMAGKDYGIFLLPDVGDEVLVGFCDGNINQPYILGSLYNSEKKQPSQIKEGKNEIRMIKTKCGHTITLVDEKDQEKIEIKSSTGINITIEDKEESIKLVDKDGKNSITINGKNGLISITADKKLELAAGKSKLTIDGEGNAVKIESGQKLEIKGQKISLGGTSVDIEGSSGVNVKSSGQTVIKGAMVKIN